MNTGLDFGALPYCIGAIVLVLALQKMLQILKAWWVQRWRVTSGVVKDTMLVPHAELARPVWGRYYSFVGVTQYIAVVNYTFHDGGIDRDGSLQQRFSIERAAHKFLTHFHTGQTVSVRHGSIWPHLSTLEFEPTILHEARSIEQPVNRKAVSIGWICRRVLFLFGIALAVCVVIGLAFLLVIIVAHRT